MMNWYRYKGMKKKKGKKKGEKNIYIYCFDKIGTQKNNKNKTNKTKFKDTKHNFTLYKN